MPRRRWLIAATGYGHDYGICGPADNCSMMTRSNDPGMLAIDLAGDDTVVPFHVAPLDIRGRAVQLGPVLNTILKRHDYPPAVAALLGESIVLTVLLGTSLKFEGRFTVQTRSDGPVSLLVVDFSTPDALRAYARFDADGVEAAVREGRAAPEQLLGKGVLAMTIDQGHDMQRFQGIVELDNRSLSEAAWQYFRQSEQIPTLVRLAAAEIMLPSENGGFESSWRAGGLVVQFLPDAPERMRQADLPGGDAPEGFVPARHQPDEAWTEASALVETIAPDELTDPLIGSERLLFRLFHEHGVRVFPGQDVRDKCSCSRERIIEIIRSLGEKERAAAAADGVIHTTCEFCGAKYTLSSDDI